MPVRPDRPRLLPRPTLPAAARAALSALAVLAATPALAQVSDPANTPGAPSTRAQRQAPREKAPPALPGARAEPDTIAPPSRNAPDLPPTEALFDSINRGDLAMAKDAINRGADIHGKNVLGLSPLELSVDLGRNQISFLLLSLRGNAGYTTSRGPVPAAGTPPSPGGETRAERLAAQRAERQERLEAARTERASRTAAAADTAPPPAAQTPRLFSGGGGAPIPQAGFLGFDSNR